MNELTMYKIAITLIPGIGDVNGKKLIAYCGGISQVFHEKMANLMKIPGVGSALAGSILRKDYLLRAEKEMEFLERSNIIPLFYLDEGYPHRLRHCEDGPIMLYFKGEKFPECTQVLGIVGTRRPTSYGNDLTSQIVQGLSEMDIMIVSGLAYGIDTMAHRASLRASLPTLAVLAHGLDELYPYVNRPLAMKIIKNGGLATEFPSGTKLNRDYFPRRNRIIAGLCDAILVVESAEKGGALITANIALSYNRDVFAIPGRTDDPKSSGCNRLIKSNKAVLVENAEDIRYQMGWDIPSGNKAIQRKLFTDLSGPEEEVWNCLPENGEADIDDICLNSGLTPGKVSSVLLKMEFDGMIACLPGKRYKRL